MTGLNRQKKRQQVTSGFTQAGVYARRQFCGNLEVYRPQEHLWSPRLRQAATTLHASGRQQRSRQRSGKLKCGYIFTILGD